MSSKYRVREIRGILEGFKNLVRALEKIENPPVRPEEEPEKKPVYTLNCHDCGQPYESDEVFPELIPH